MSLILERKQKSAQRQPEHSGAGEVAGFALLLGAAILGVKGMGKRAAGEATEAVARQTEKAVVKEVAEAGATASKEAIESAAKQPITGTGHTRIRNEGPARVPDPSRLNDGINSLEYARKTNAQRQAWLDDPNLAASQIEHAQKMHAGGVDSAKGSRDSYIGERAKPEEYAGRHATVDQEIAKWDELYRNRAAMDPLAYEGYGKLSHGYSSAIDGALPFLPNDVAERAKDMVDHLWLNRPMDEAFIKEADDLIGQAVARRQGTTVSADELLAHQRQSTGKTAEAAKPAPTRPPEQAAKPPLLDEAATKRQATDPPHVDQRPTAAPKPEAKTTSADDALAQRRAKVDAEAADARRVKEQQAAELQKADEQRRRERLRQRSEEIKKEEAAKAEANAKAKAEAEAKKAEEEARRKADEAAQRQEAEAKRKAEAEPKRKAEEPQQAEAKPKPESAKPTDAVTQFNQDWDGVPRGLDPAAQAGWSQKDRALYPWQTKAYDDVSRIVHDNGGRSLEATQGIAGDIHMQAETYLENYAGNNLDADFRSWWKKKGPERAYGDQIDTDQVLEALAPHAPSVNNAYAGDRTASAAGNAQKEAARAKQTVADRAAREAREQADAAEMLRGEEIAKRRAENQAQRKAEEASKKAASDPNQK